MDRQARFIAPSLFSTRVGSVPPVVDTFGVHRLDSRCLLCELSPTTFDEQGGVMMRCSMCLVVIGVLLVAFGLAGCGPEIRDPQPDLGTMPLRASCPDQSDTAK